jgi:hypothetical protein
VTRRKSHGPAILRALDMTKHGRTKTQLIAYLGAQDAYDAVDYDLQTLRKQGFIAYRRKEVVPGFGARMWYITKGGAKMLATWKRQGI